MVFALSKDLRTIQTTEESTVFALGLARNAAVKFKTANGSMEERSPFYKSKYNDASDGVGYNPLFEALLGKLTHLKSVQIEDFLTDFENARGRAYELDQRILKSAGDVSKNLTDLVSLTTRNIMGAMDITQGSNSDDIMIFVKGMWGLEDAISKYV